MACWCFRCWSNSERWAVSPSKAQVGKDGGAFQCGWRRFWRYYSVVHLAVISQTTLLNHSASTSSNFKFWAQICCRSTNTWVACPHTHTKRLCWNPMHHLWRAMSLYMHLVIANVVCLQLSSLSAMICHGQQSQQKHACNLRFLPSIVAIWVSTCHNTCITADPLLALAPNSGTPAVVDNQTWLLLK